MKAAIIAIGHELLTGDVLDTNSRFIAECCTEVGINVQRIVLLDDAEADITAELARAAEVADIVFTTGGLGPTTDDKTRQAIARAAGEELVQLQESVDRLAAYAQRRNRPLNANNLRQSYFPRSASILVNDWGTADAFITPLPGTGTVGRSGEENARGAIAISLPGVPDELRALMDKRVLPWLRANASLPPPNPTVCLRCFGLAEANIGEAVEALALPQGIDVAYRPQFPEILLKLTHYGPAIGAAAQTELAQAQAMVTAALGPEFVISQNEREELPAVIARLLIERGFTLAAAESCSGGLLAHTLVTISGASRFFLASLVTYSNAAKTAFADVPPETLRDHGAVSPETAEALARGARERTGANFGLSITGIAGPDGGSEEKPVGTVWIGLACAQSVQSFRYQLPWQRAKVREYSVYLALDLLRRRLLDYPLRK